MATEIEHKFTLKNENWRQLVTKSERLVQGYLAGNERSSVRIRIVGDKANLNIKSATLGVFRQEYEYDIPLADGEKILEDLCEKPVIDKVRHYVEYSGKTWEIDEFSGENKGLIVAEIELDAENEAFAIPDWADQDVSGDPRYYNVSLVKHPFKNW